ncbi:hypothetical protein GCM10027406_36240 [Leifsonia lichenia]
MTVPTDDEIVVTDGRASTTSRLYHWFLDHLAKFPGRVTAVTFAAGAVVTVAVVLIDGDGDATTIVSLIATLWALFFAVMIYLLTARDTDKVLDQIADLHEQLATALAAPEEEEEERPEEEAPQETDAETTEEPSLPEPPGHERPAAPAARPVRPGQRAHPQPRLLEGEAAIVAAVPGELLAAWTSATGKARDALSRAWTRDPRSGQQWVLETADHQRWVVFSRGARGVGVIPLDATSRARLRRSRGA